MSDTQKGFHNDLGRVGLAEAERLLEKRFLGKQCSLMLPGLRTVYGMVERISINTRTMADIIVFIGKRQYSFEISALNDCLQLLSKKPDGNT